MRKLAVFIASAGIVAGTLAGAQSASAAAVDNTNSVAPAQPITPSPAIAALDCFGTTGTMGCGPGWQWRDGWYGPRCYIC